MDLLSIHQKYSPRLNQSLSRTLFCSPLRSDAGTARKRLKTFPRNSRPQLDSDCLICAEIAQQWRCDLPGVSISLIVSLTVSSTVSLTISLTITLTIRLKINVDCVSSKAQVVEVESHMQTLMIYKLSCNQSCYTFALI